MRRYYLMLIVAGGLALFLVISALLARAFSVDSAERSAVTELIQAEARGDRAGMLARIQGCSASAACRARIALNAARLTRRGPIAIIQLQLSSGFSLTGTVGTARVAWNAPSALPVVQCVRVRRAGNVLAGMKVELLAISVRIKSDSECPPSY